MKKIVGLAFCTMLLAQASMAAPNPGLSRKADPNLGYRWTGMAKKPVDCPDRVGSDHTSGARFEPASAKTAAANNLPTDNQKRSR